MDSFEIAKIAGAVLSALLVIVGAKTAIDMNAGGHGGHGSSADAVGYVLETEADGTHDATAASEGKSEAVAFDPAAVVALVAESTAEGGKKVFKKCAGCHNAAAGAGVKTGPNLWGVVGRAKGSSADFTRYSDGMHAKGGTWTLEDLALFLHKPKAFIPGTRMTFKGVKKDSDLAKLLAYLATLK